MIDPKRYIGDIVMKNQIELLEQQVRELKREKEQLEKENIRLQKALNKKGKRLNFRHGYKNPRPHFCNLIIPGLSEPPVRTLRATIPENESHIFR